MKRLIFYDLLAWRHAPTRKPLLLRGARQVGKTHIVRELGRTFKYFVELNFEKNPTLIKIFEYDLDPIRIIRDIALALNKRIEPGSTLLFLDEIRIFPRVVLALRYFYEDVPELHVIAAGSLLDFAIDQVGVPVGRVSFLYLYPLSFIEFLCAMNFQHLANEIIHHTPEKPLNEAIHIKALRLLGEYMAIGGMPNVVQQWVTQQDALACTTILNDIKNAYEQDFSKYAKHHEIKYVDLLFKKIPALVSEQFRYSHISTDFRKRELEPALWLLEKAGIVHPVIYSSGQGLPLGGEIDSHKFKLLTLDVGLNQAILGLKLKEWFINPEVNLVNKGSLTESFVGQELLAYPPATDRTQLYYWYRDKRGSQAEIDYLISLNGKILPIEVKSGHGAGMQSIKVFLDTHPDSPYGIRFSTQNYSIHDAIRSYPLYAVAGIVGNRLHLMKMLDVE